MKIVRINYFIVIGMFCYIYSGWGVLGVKNNFGLVFFINVVYLNLVIFLVFIKRLFLFGVCFIIKFFNGIIDKMINIYIGGIFLEVSNVVVYVSWVVLKLL